MSYQEQLMRTRRWLKRFQEATSLLSTVEGSVPPDDLLSRFEPYVNCEDYAYAFFQNCWHLKDWILRDSDAPVALKEAVKKIEQESAVDALMLCADVANGSKHFAHGRSSRRGGQRSVEIEIDIGPTGDTEIANYSFTVVDNKDNRHDPLLLAQQSLSEWEKIITDNGGCAD
jgi:hypothetical protein